MALHEVQAAFEVLSEDDGYVKKRDLATVLQRLEPGFWTEEAVNKLLDGIGVQTGQDKLKLSDFIQAIGVQPDASASTLATPLLSTAPPFQLERFTSLDICRASICVDDSNLGRGVENSYLAEHGFAKPNEADLRYIREHGVVQKLKAFIQILLWMKPQDLDRFGTDYFSGALASQKFLVLICSDVDDREVLRGALRPRDDFGTPIISADWDFQAAPTALTELVECLQQEHGIFKTVAMCCHGSTDLLGFDTRDRFEAALQAKWEELGQPDLFGGVPDLESAREALKIERGCAETDSKNGKWLLTASAGIDLSTGIADPDVEDAIRACARAASVRLDILACNLVATEAGLRLIRRWEKETKTNIAASDDVTGNVQAGGDWVLETDGIDVAAVYFDEVRLSKWSGSLARGARGWQITDEQKENISCSLFELLDRNGTGVLEEFEWSQGCRWSRRVLKAKPNNSMAGAVFGKIDEDGTGAINACQVKGQLQEALRALGMSKEQALEALHLLQEQRVREADGDTSILDVVLPDEEDAEAEEAADEQQQGSNPEQAGWQPALPQRNTAERRKAQEMAQRHSARRGQVLHQFLAMLEPRGTPSDAVEAAAQEAALEAERAKPLAVRAKKAAWQAVASDQPLPSPPDDLELSFELDSLYAGGENLWVSAEIGCAKKDEEEEATGEAEEDQEGEMPKQTTKRMPADLLLVVDVSGSMSSALPSVRKCLASLAGLVEPQDRLALVKFDNLVNVVLPWTAMDADGIQEFRTAQADLVARGGTCFVPVLQKCLKELLEDEVPGRTRSMLFISDGMPEERDQEILELVCAASTSPNMSIITAGFGTGVKADLMGNISQAGCGPFIYIPDEQSIPVQLGRVWAAVAYTSVCASFMLVRPLGGATVTAVEGAFGTAELCLRPDGGKSDQQVMLVQVGPVRHGTTREVAFRLQLPDALQQRPLSDKKLRSPLVEVSIITETVAQVDGFDAPVFLQKAEFLPLQVPSLLADSLLPFPMRFVLENDLDGSFDADAALRQMAECLGIDQSELQLNQVLSGSIIIDVSLKMEPKRAAEVLKDVGSAKFQAKMGEKFEQMGYKLKSATAPGQQVFKRLLQTRFAGALGKAAETTSKNSKTDDVPELRAVKKLAGSDLAESLDPPVKGSMTAAVQEDCTAILKVVKETACDSGKVRQDMHHNMLQMQAAHTAQVKCAAKAASLEVYEVKEAKVAAQQMDIACGGVRATTALLDSTSERLEMRTHASTGDRMGVFLMLRPMFGHEEDFSFLAKELCPTFQVQLKPEGGSPKVQTACAFPVHEHNMMPVCVRTKHPTTLEDQVGGKINVPCARRLKICVDKRSCVGGTLSFYVDCTCQKPFKVVHHDGETHLYEKPETFFVKGADVWYTYQHAKGATIAQIEENWGFEFEVTVADDKDATSTESRLRGMLLQAKFADVPPGSYTISAMMNDAVYEVPPSSITAIEMGGRDDSVQSLVSNTNQCLQLAMTHAMTLGVRTPARFIGVNGAAAKTKEQAKSLGSVPSTESVQAVILTSAEHACTSIEEFEKTKVANILKNRHANFAGSMKAQL